jgi:hypothetical protein
LSAAFLAGCSLFGIRSGYEQPPYKVIDRVGTDVEIRQYEPRLTAVTTVEAADADAAANAGFRILADYIFGANRKKTKIDMTAPVEVGRQSEKIAMTAPVETAESAPGRYTMRFFLPAALTEDTAPEPLDARVRIETVPGETVAVLRFAGIVREKNVSQHRQKLMDALAASRWAAAAAPKTLYYDPPWTLPFLRRNEVLVSVQAR